MVRESIRTHLTIEEYLTGKFRKFAMEYAFHLGLYTHFSPFERIFRMCDTIVIDNQDFFIFQSREFEDIPSEITSFDKFTIFFFTGFPSKKYFYTRSEIGFFLLHETREIESVPIWDEIICLLEDTLKFLIFRCLKKHFRIRSEDKE